MHATGVVLVAAALVSVVTSCNESELLAQVSELSQRVAVAKGAYSGLAPGDALAVLRSAAGLGSRLRDEMDALLIQPLWTEDTTSFDHYEIVFREKRTLGILFGERGEAGVVVKDLSAKGDAKKSGQVKNGDELVAINMVHVLEAPISDIGDHISEGDYPKVFRFRRKRGSAETSSSASAKSGQAPQRQRAQPHQKGASQQQGAGGRPKVQKHPDGSFSVQVADAASLGIGLIDDMSVSSVKASGPFHGIVEVGDRLIRVANTNLGTKSLPEVVRLIKSSSAPFEMRFEVTDGRDPTARVQGVPGSGASAKADDQAEEDDEPLTHLGAEGELVLTAPPILAGARYKVQFASFGEASSCTERNVSMHIDSAKTRRLGMACGKHGPAVPYGGSDSLVFVLRGECTFVTKARNVMRAGGSGMVVVTRDFEPITTMPAGVGELRPGPIRGPAVMMEWKDGNSLLGLLRKGPLRAVLRDPHCPDAGAGTADIAADSDDNEQYAVEELEGGRTRKRYQMLRSLELLVWDSVSGETHREIGVLGEMGGFKYESFPLVSAAEPTVLVLAPGEKGTACKKFPMSGQYEGAIVVAWRGECSFADKAIAVQNAGGVGLILVNADQGVSRLQPMIIQPELEKAVKIPGMTITPAAGDRLRKILSGPEPSPDGFGLDSEATKAAPPPLVIAKFFRKTFYYCNRAKGIICGIDESD
ncbi:Signal peptide peptidase-like 3 [Hondaea fermentalgiana]|uniref:Signal peptide peptidase-like 3 n=1 Tax=Hondaea fermentalgiana TaxID=2315210 RepID=A0A2R5GJ61_9STRA|nr:Signal peptide peptidase-like 3 [Hondaea fermentalgiana]|eukprot:GBG30926.1 Signal peptide peptidase-like 3 [Hondaea fermentalgiana]